MEDRPTFKHDIFVSYAHVDDMPPVGEQLGWVSIFLQSLKIELARKLGRQESFSLWSDCQLSRTDPVTSQLMETLGDSAVLLIMLSPAYIKSDWCRTEMDTFFKIISQRPTPCPMVFVVELNRMEETQRPIQLTDILGYKFWALAEKTNQIITLGWPRLNPGSEWYDKYHYKLSDLAEDLGKALGRLQKPTRQNAMDQGDKLAKGMSTSYEPAVFLSEVTDDIEEERDAVMRYLGQAGVKVLPARLYPRDPTDFKRALMQDIAACKLFVQLLSGLPGKKPPELPQGYARFQHECALEACKTVLQWRNRNLDVTAIRDKQHSALLQGETVLAVGLEEFKRTIVERVFYEPLQVARKTQKVFVFVNTESSDRPLAKTLFELLEGYGLEVALPLQDGSPREIREDLEKNLLDCDGLIIVYGKTTASWVREQLRQCRKIIYNREQPIKALAVYEGPPEAKIPLDFKLQSMQVINCRQCFGEDKIRCFVNGLEKEEA